MDLAYYQDRDGNWHKGQVPGYEQERDDIPFPKGGYPSGGSDTSPIVDLPPEVVAAFERAPKTSSEFARQQGGFTGILHHVNGISPRMTSNALKGLKGI